MSYVILKVENLEAWYGDAKVLHGVSFDLKQGVVLALIGSSGAAFSVNDWTAFIIFIVVIGGIGTVEGPIIGTIVYFSLREFLGDLGSIYLLLLDALAIIIMLVTPKSIWGFIIQRWNISLFPTGYRVNSKE